MSKKSESPQASHRAGFRHFAKNKNAKKYVFFHKKQIYFCVSFAYSENIRNYICRQKGYGNMAGKKSGGSESIYNEKINRGVNNKVLDNPRVHYPENKEDWKVPAFYLRYFSPKSNVVHITTDPLNIDDSRAKPRFLSFIKRYEENNNIRLCDVSKGELLYSFLDFVEHTNSIIALKDDSEQFVPYRFKFPDVMKLYFYKLLYPEIFDYDIVEGESGKTIKFKSIYLEENFPEIYRDMEFLFLAILYDALIIAIERSSIKQINSMKSYNESINPKYSVSDLKEDLEILLNFSYKKARKKAKIKNHAKRFLKCLFPA